MNQKEYIPTAYAISPSLVIGSSKGSHLSRYADYQKVCQLKRIV